MKDIDLKPKFVMLIGLVGSGKSTWTKKFLSEHPDYIVASSDDIIDKYAQRDGITYTEAFPKYIKQAAVEFNAILQNALKNRNNVIVDRTNLTKNVRRKILSNVPSDYKKTAVTFTVPRDEINRRLLQREYEIGKSIPKDVVDSMERSYEEPSVDEGFSEIIHV